MSWKSHSVHTMKSLYNNEKFSSWANAINENGTQDLSDTCNDLLERLADMIQIEIFEKSNSSDHQKILKVLEMAAVGGKTL